MGLHRDSFTYIYVMNLKIVIKQNVLLAYFPYFEKMKVGVAISMLSVYPCISFLMSEPIFMKLCILWHLNPS
jgi:hypothetical protein